MIEYHPQDEEEFELPSPRLEYTTRFTVDLVAPVWELGATSDLGRRRIIRIAWRQLRRAVAERRNPEQWRRLANRHRGWNGIIDTRYLLKLDDDSLAYLQTRAYRDR
jgi:hypothetical protein